MVTRGALTDGPGIATKKGGLGSPAQALALATLCGVLFLTFLDNTIVSVGLANVQTRKLGGSMLRCVTNQAQQPLRTLSMVLVVTT